MRNPRRVPVLVAAVMAAMAAGAGADEVRRINDFETAAERKDWEFRSGTPRLVREGVAHGRRALEITFDPEGRYAPAYLTWKLPRRQRQDWSGFDALVLDVTNPADEPMPAYLLIADQAWRDKGRTYWNRHNASRTLAPGRTRWVIPLGGLYRGEAGSRNNDIKRGIDTDKIVRLDFGLGRKGAAGRVIIDDLRLVRVDRPEGVWAFDFGPPDQSVMLGWTGISQRTVWKEGRGFGWGPTGGGPWNGAARDTTFATALLRDFCEAGGYRFHVACPPGEYRVAVIYENSGYWGGQQARHRTRKISVDGKVVWSETRKDGPAHALWRFEDVEPVGADLWDTYMGPELAAVNRFDATAGQNGLTLRFEADRVWGSKLAGMAVHRKGDEAAARWLNGQIEQMAEEFRSRAVCLDRPVGDWDPPAAWADRGATAWPVALSEDVSPHTLPPEKPAGPGELRLSALAVRGEQEALCLAVRPADDLGRCRLDFHWTDPAKGPPAEVNVVRYKAGRGFNSLAYRIKPHTLRPTDAVELPADVTRELVLRLTVPADAEPGEYVGRLTVSPKDGRALQIPVRLTVADAALDRETDFRMGFFGLMPPGLLPEDRRWETLDKTLAMLRRYGMNTVCGGPSWRLVGWEDGRPVIDYGEMDRFFALLRRHGFTGPLNGYGGARFRGLHHRYEAGPVAAKVARDSGMKYEEAVMAAWRAVDVHARRAGWPVIWYAMCDETRVREEAERELEFMRLMAKVSAAFPRTVRTSGSYSVTFKRRPKDKDDLLSWHQRFFEALDISDLNGHDPTVMAEAARLGKEVHIYNQGRSRYSFGLYQWSEFRKGVAARTQWHLNILHGYQFFDLDGREPDNAMICYGRERIHPTIHFERCREGAEDFSLLNTLARRVEAAEAAGGPADRTRAAAAMLKRLADSVSLNQRTPPAGYDPEATKRAVIRELRRLE
jgi:hypothetical protein